MNLLNVLQNQLDGNVIGKLAGLAGGSSAATKGAIGMILPKLLGGISEKASNLSGAESLMGMIKDGGHDGSVMNNLSSVLAGGDDTKKYLDSGKSLVSSLLGDRADSVTNSINTASSLTKEGNASLMSALAPMLMGTLGGHVTKNNLDAAGLKSLLADQTAGISGSVSNVASGAKSTVSGAANTATKAVEAESKSGGGIFKFLLPLLLLAGLAWYFMKPSGAAKTTTATETEVTATGESAEYSAEEKKAMSRDASGDAKYTLDANGNLVDANGNIITKAGEFTRDANGVIKDKTGKVISGAASIGTAAKTVMSGKDGAPNMDKTATPSGEKGYYVDDKGNLVDEKGNISFEAGSYTEKDGYYVDKDGNTIGKMLGKLADFLKGAAKDVAGAVGSGAEAFAGAFKNLFSKKDKVGSTYSLQQIDFNSENHRIEKFSKDEVVALAASLKAYPDAKIQVQVHTDDGKDAKENNKLSSLRAKVVEDMLITLGVNKKQISAKGMGSENTAKAAGGKVEIMVEK